MDADPELGLDCLMGGHRHREASLKLFHPVCPAPASTGDPARAKPVCAKTMGSGLKHTRHRFPTHAFAHGLISAATGWFLDFKLHLPPLRPTEATKLKARDGRSPGLNPLPWGRWQFATGDRSAVVAWEAQHAPCWIRTNDRLLRRQLLYPLS